MPSGPDAGGQTTVQAGVQPGSYEGDSFSAWLPTSVGGDDAMAEGGADPIGVVRPGQELEETFFTYADQAAFENPNAQDIYGVINYGLNDMSQQSAPGAGNAAAATAATMGPGMMLGGAAIAPQMLVDSATLNTGRDLQYEQAQGQLANALYAASQGMGPSVAEFQAKLEAERAIQAQMAALASGGGSPLGARAAQLDASRQLQAAAQAGALGRSQEAMAAQQALGGLIGGARGQAQTTAQTQAQLQQQALLANKDAFNQAAQAQAQLNQQAGLANQQYYQQALQQNAEMQQAVELANQSALNQFSLADQQAILSQRELNNSLYQQMLAQYQQENQQDITNAVAYQQLLGQEQLGLLQVNAGMESSGQGITSGLASAAMSAGGAMLAMSDRRAKRNVRPAKSVLRAFLDDVAAAELETW